MFFYKKREKANVGTVFLCSHIVKPLLIHLGKQTIYRYLYIIYDTIFFLQNYFLCDWKAFIMLFVLKKGGKYFFIKVLCYQRNVWKILAKLPFLVKLSIPVYPWMGPMFLSLRTAKCPGSCLMSRTGLRWTWANVSTGIQHTKKMDFQGRSNITLQILFIFFSLCTSVSATSTA